MTHNNNLNPLPWYTSLGMQNHRKSYAYGKVYPLFTLTNFMLPWQVEWDSAAQMFTQFVIYHEDGTVWRDVTAQAAHNTELVTVTYYDAAGNAQSVSKLVFVPRFALANDQPDGRYYAMMTDGDDITLYSEVYTVVNSLDGYLAIEWWDDEDLVLEDDVLVYSSASPRYRNRIYLPTELGKPEYTYEEEGENRDGYFFPAKQLSEKIYRFTFLAPEYMLDALRIVRLSDHAVVTSPYGITYDTDSFLITPQWLQNGDLASVTAEIQVDTVIKKIGRASVTGSGSGDYDDSYSKNDFDVFSNN